MYKKLEGHPIMKLIHTAPTEWEISSTLRCPFSAFSHFDVHDLLSLQLHYLSPIRFTSFFELNSERNTLTPPWVDLAPPYFPDSVQISVSLPNREEVM